MCHFFLPLKYCCIRFYNVVHIIFIKNNVQTINIYTATKAEMKFRIVALKTSPLGANISTIDNDTAAIHFILSVPFWRYLQEYFFQQITFDLCFNVAQIHISNDFSVEVLEPVITVFHTWGNESLFK